MTIQELKQTIGTRDLVRSVEHLRMKMRGRRNCTLYMTNRVFVEMKWEDCREAELRGIKFVEVEGR